MSEEDWAAHLVNPEPPSELAPTQGRSSAARDEMDQTDRLLEIAGSGPWGEGGDDGPRTLYPGGGVRVGLVQPPPPRTGAQQEAHMILDILVSGQKKALKRHKFPVHENFGSAGVTTAREGGDKLGSTPTLPPPGPA